MRGIIMHDNGRLKTGRLSLFFFLCLLLGFGALFSLQKPVDKAVVVVRHIFTASPEAKVQKVPLKEPVKASPQYRQELVKLTQTTPVEKIREIKQIEEVKSEIKNSKVKEKLETSPEKPTSTQSQQKKPASKKADSGVEELSQAALKTAQISAPSAAKVVAVADIPVKQAPPAPAPVFEKPEPVAKREPLQSDKPLTVPEAIDKNVHKDKIEPQKISVQAKLDPEEQIVDYQQAWQPLLKSKPASLSLMSDAARQRLQGNLPHKSSPLTAVKKSKFAALKLSIPKKVKPEIKKKAEKLMVQLKPKPASPANSKVGAGTQSITVEKDEYTALHRAWREVGEGEKENDQLIPLRIENLRSAYSFLQMKAVVILADDNCIDLSDGSRIPAASLDRFSSTVIRVDDPWQKWGSELRQAGLRPDQSFEVRYYLYDFVRRSIYARVNQAYNWSLNQGRLETGTKPAEIDVLGRAYVVKRSDGGSFGVFVPQSLATRDGQIIDVDPLCFSNAPDIAALHAKGII